MADRMRAAAGAGGAGRREQILRAAREIIMDRGFAETRISDVAERIGISPALVLYYFETKKVLLTEAIRYSEDNWYAEGLRRLAAIPTAAGRLEEIVAMSCLPEADPEPVQWWLLWLELWAQSARYREVAAVRQQADQRWRELIISQVLAGQRTGEFRGVDAHDFAIGLSCLLDGFAIQVALEDPVVSAETAFETSMRFVADQLGFDWVCVR